MYLPDTASVITWRQHKYISLCIKLKGKNFFSNLGSRSTVNLPYFSENYFFQTKPVPFDLNNVVLIKKNKPALSGLLVLAGFIWSSWSPNLDKMAYSGLVGIQP